MENIKRETKRGDEENAGKDGKDEASAGLSVIARRKSCAAEGAGLSHYVVMERKAQE